MIGCLRTRVRKQPIIALYFESENELKFYNLEARARIYKLLVRIENWEALIVLLKEIFEKVNFEKSQQTTTEA